MSIIEQYRKENEALRQENAQMKEDIKAAYVAVIKQGQDFGFDFTDPEAMKKVSWATAVPKLTMKLMSGTANLSAIQGIMPRLEKYKHLID